jgi:hypothetical protein
MTTHLLASTRSEQLPGDEMLAMWKSLSGYLACEQPQEPEDQRPDLDALALMQEQMKVT